jgi:hypothetical protein
MYATRHRLPVPRLACWLLILGIVAPLAANMAQSWSHGPVGAVVAAWLAASLVGSYELALSGLSASLQKAALVAYQRRTTPARRRIPIAGARFGAVPDERCGRRLPR